MIKEGGGYSKRLRLNFSPASSLRLQNHTRFDVNPSASYGTVALMFLGQFSDICKPQGYRFHPIKNLRNCDLDFVAPFNSNFDNKTLCESGVMWIIRFVNIFIYSFPYLLTHYHNKCLQIKRSRHLVIAIFSL